MFSSFFQSFFTQKIFNYVQNSMKFSWNLNTYLVRSFFLSRCFTITSIFCHILFLIILINNYLQNDFNIKKNIMYFRSNLIFHITFFHWSFLFYIHFVLWYFYCFFQAWNCPFFTFFNFEKKKNFLLISFF